MRRSPELVPLASLFAEQSYVGYRLHSHPPHEDTTLGAYTALETRR